MLITAWSMLGSVRMELVVGWGALAVVAHRSVGIDVTADDLLSALIAYEAIRFREARARLTAEEVAEIRNRKEVIDSAVSSDMVARVEGNTGIVTGVYRLTGRDEKGQPMDRRIRYTDVFVKRDGRWLVGMGVAAAFRNNEIDAYGVTHPGKVRRDNQDHYLLCSLRRQVVDDARRIGAAR